VFVYFYLVGGVVIVFEGLVCLSVWDVFYVYDDVYGWDLIFI